MKTKTVTIHIFDDQPGIISHVISRIPHLIRKHQPSWLVKKEIPSLDPHFEEAFRLTVLHQSDESIELVCKFYTSSEQFVTEAKVEGGDVVLLDLMENENSGAASLGAKKCCGHIKNQVPPERILLMSAFHTKIPVALGLDRDADSLIRKPFNSEELMLRLLALAGVDPLILEDKP